MKLVMRRFEKTLSRELEWSTMLCGNPTDERGRASISFLESRSRNISYCDYKVESQEFTCNGTTSITPNNSEILSKIVNTNLIIDATTLGFCEMLIVTRALYTLGVKNYDILYVEPLRYRRASNSDLQYRDFEISEPGVGFYGIRGFSRNITHRRAHLIVFLLGYEGSRLQSCESIPFESETATPVFTIPAFRACWEMDAFVNHIEVLRNLDLTYGIVYCGGDNPLSVYKLLSRQYETATKLGRFLTIAPFGTRPNGVGAALFSATHRDVNILYDHPVHRSFATCDEERSYEVGAWHLYTVHY